jgi:hypothetical protein
MMEYGLYSRRHTSHSSVLWAIGDGKFRTIGWMAVRWLNCFDTPCSTCRVIHSDWVLAIPKEYL